MFIKNVHENVHEYVHEQVHVHELVFEHVDKLMLMATATVEVFEFSVPLDEC